MDVFGTASAAVSLLDHIIRLIGRAKAAAASVKDLPGLLDAYGTEAAETKDWVVLVTQDTELEIPEMQPAMAGISRAAAQIKEHLEKMNTKRGAVKQFIHQFSSGESERILLDKLVRDMAYAKIDLMVRVQLVLIGISRNIQDVTRVNVEAIKALDAKLPASRPTARYPKLSKLLDKNKPNPDGTLTVTKEDLDDLLKEEGVELQPAQASGAGRRAQKRIGRNKISETAFVVSGPQCAPELDPWRDADFTFEDNTIDGYALVHAQPTVDALKILAEARVQEMKYRFGGGGAKKFEPDACADKMDTSR